jgi:hypothetical protein
MTRSRTKHRGFATTMALMLVALVGSAILAVTMLSAGDFRRTAAEARDAQLRQLVLAATTDVRERLRAGQDVAGQSFTIELPAVLNDSGARVDVRATRTDSGLRVEIVAHLGDQKLAQDLTITGSGKDISIAVAPSG